MTTRKTAPKGAATPQAKPAKPRKAKRSVSYDATPVDLRKEMKYEIYLTNVPDGAYTENYLGASRTQPTKAAARKIVAAFNRAKRERPEDFEPEMTAEILPLGGGKA